VILSSAAAQLLRTKNISPEVLGDLIQSVHDVPVLADAVVVVGGGYELCR
jgi:hypothetical protein